MATAVPDFVDVAPFFCLAGGRWWQFKEVSGGGSARMECADAGAGQLKVMLSVAGKPTEQLLRVTPVEAVGVETQQYTYLQTTASGTTLTWNGGLALPVPWKTGDKVSATSRENNPATGHPIRRTVGLDRVGPFKPPAGSPFHAEVWSIQITETLVDSGTGMSLAKVTSVFALGLGLASMTSIIFGVTSILQFADWSGAH